MNTAHRIYLDHAATSWPKPEGVLEAMDRFARDCGAAAGRGSYRSALDAGQVIDSLRRSLAQRIHAESPRCVSFHPSGTAALNAAIHGLVRPNDHVVTTAAEHNSVLRPLHHLAQHSGVQLSVVPCDAAGRVTAEAVLSAVRDETRLVAVTHASNVTGAVQPVDAIGEGLRPHRAALLCDAAQTFGYLPIDVQAMNVDLLAAPGHKGSQGPLGTGFLYVRQSWHDEIGATIQGGTGSQSESLEMPSEMPTKLESGIANTPALAGWMKALSLLDATLAPASLELRSAIDADLRSRLAAISGIELIGDRAAEEISPMPTTLPIVSIRMEGLSPADLATILDVEFGVEVRAGLHCAALIHSRLGSLPEGTLRVSVGHPTHPRDIDALITAMTEIASGMS